jgi:hypothetical protein
MSFHPFMMRLRERLGLFWREDAGTIAIKFALAVPALALVGAGAMDLTHVQSTKARLDDIADSAALAGASDLGLATDGSNATERARAFVESHLAEWEKAPALEGTYEIVDLQGQRAIRVSLDANRPSFFANLLPPGGWDIHAEATATSVGIVPLCVLVTGSSGNQMLYVKDRSRMNAPSCLVHSNRDIEVEGAATLSAAAVHAVTVARGLITPEAGTDAAPLDDPFANLDLERDRGLGVLCGVEELTRRIRVDSGTHRIPPGRHCGGIEARGTARILLDPGEHFFLMGDLVIDENARLEGVDVVAFFDQQSRFQFTGSARVSLDGRKTGLYAGMVMGAMRSNRQDFVVSADHVESLLGVIYVPSARLIVEGSADVARDSAWTVIVAKELQMKGSPSLFINANYDASDVPVPQGVGPREGDARLVR